MAEFSLVLTCEHGGNSVPEAFRPLFHGHDNILASHQGWDPGALDLACHLAGALNAPLFHSDITRLLVDLNRSIHHPKLFSEFTRGLAPAERENILASYYRPFREQVAREVHARLECGLAVLHLSLHSFTPVLDNRARNSDLGLLYDPRRAPEKAVCRQLKAALTAGLPGLRIRFNYPYRGVSDGHTTALRRLFPQGYLGIELEVNQAVPLGDPSYWNNFRRRLALALANLT